MSSYRENKTDILRTKAMLSFASFSIPMGGKNAPFIYPALKALILIRNGSLTPEDSKGPKEKTVWEQSYLISRTSYEYLKYVS